MTVRRIATAALGLLAACAGSALAPSASRAGDSIVQFHSPSGNIACSLDNTYKNWHARCDIKQHTWTHVPKPKSCHFDYSFGLQLASSGRAHVLCASDTEFGSWRSHDLPYGHSIARGRIRCTSMVTGVECVTAHPRHGFVISRDEALLF